MRFGRPARALAIVAAVAVALGIAVLAFGPAAPGAKPRLLGSILLYWIAFSLITLSVFHWRRHRAKILALLLSSILSLGILEIGLRVLLPVASMPRLRGLPSVTRHHLFPPNATMFAGYVAGEPIIVRTNDDGLRTDRSRAEFLASETRIAVIGDSFVMGVGVPQELAMPQRMEAVLRERTGGRDIAVLNAGVNSYAPFIEMLQFEQVVRHYKPQVCLMLLDSSDIAEDWTYAHEYDSTEGGKPSGRFIDRAPMLPPYRGAVDQLILHPYVFDVARFPLGLVWPSRFGDPPPQGWPVRIEIEPGKIEGRWFHYRHPPEKTRPYFEHALSHARQTAKMANEIGCRFILVVFPRYQHWNLRECAARPEAGGYSDNEPYQFEYLKFFDEAAGREEFEIVNLLPSFKATAAFPLCFEHDIHWNRQGCDFVARVLADRLLKNGAIGAAGARSRPNR